ncbi:MAG: reverse transcriptase domain-containing protein, partial [Pirellulales bacterium]|nr:reverse transcriptase domain-containing protein [Pirellulales bacterium]
MSQLSKKPSKVMRASYLNPDAFRRFIGPKNLGKALIDGELTTCLLDNGSQLNFVTPAFVQERGMDVLSLDYLAQEIGGSIPAINGLGGNPVDPTGFVLMNVKVPCVQGYDEDQVAIVLDDPEMSECPVILGTPTLYRVMEVIKESEISKLAIPWASSRISWLMRDVLAKVGQVVVEGVANKPISPLDVDEVVRVASKCTVPPFGQKVIHGRINLVLRGHKMNVMTHGLEKKSPSLPLGIDVQTAYATLADGSNRVTVVLKNTTRDWLEVKKGIPIARMVAANEVPKVTNLFSAEKPKEQPTLTEIERQDLLLEKLDLSGLEAWPADQAEKARGLLREYHDIFSLEKHDMGHTQATKHKIVLKDPDAPPFKERFRRIPPPQLDEVRAHLKMMLDAGVIRPSNSPWCNAVVLVRKKDGSLRFCIDFRRLNALTVKDSYPLPRICETLESLAGAAHYSTFDMNSGFWQVPMDEDSKQYTAFTLGSMGLYECESMPFGLCNAPPTFQRLMLNCLGELNLTYCLIYLDDVIIFSHTEEEHLERMRVVFDRLREHGLKLKPSKCEVFKTEINYLAHHVSSKGVLPSKRNLQAIAECPPPDTYTKVKSFVGLVGHYRRFIKGFANIAAPLYDLTSGENKDKRSEHLDLPPEAREAFDRLKASCLQAPILSFPDFTKPFLLETDASGKGLGAVLSQKQADGRYHPIAYASRIMNETEQRYHSNKQEFLALKWAITEQFHEYLSPYGKNRNEFVVRTDNNPLTYIFSTANLDAAGQRWVAHLASYNFALEYQKGKDNTVADFLSRLDDRLPEGEVQDYLNKIPYPGVKAVLDNAITPLTERAEQGLRPNPDYQVAVEKGTITARPARLATTNVTDWKLEQKADPVLYQVVKNRKASKEAFKEALGKVADRKAVAAYVKSKDQFLMKNGLLYRQSKQGPIEETVFQFVVPQVHRNVALDGCHREAAHQGQHRSLSLMKERFWWPGMARDLRNRIKKCGRCRKFEAAPPIAPMKPLACSGPGELLHVDFTSIEETVPLRQEPVIRNVMVMQDHFSKFVVAYVVKDQTARTAAETLRNGYFGILGAPAYLVSDQGKAFTGHLITHLCELYGVQKLRTSPYHA